jgi:hypothetical protein
MNSCGKLTPCHSVDYTPKTKTCYYGDSHEEPAINGTNWMSARLMGCAGACKQRTCKNNNAPLAVL